MYDAYVEARYPFYETLLETRGLAILSPTAPMLTPFGGVFDGPLNVTLSVETGGAEVLLQFILTQVELI